MKILKRKIICTYDPVSMQYKHIKRPLVLTYIIGTIVLSIAIGAITLSTTQTIIKKHQVVDYEKVPIILDCNLAFSEEAMYDLLVGMNVKFPHIVIAQARIESGHYTSNLFKRNNNMFGMKCAKSRATTHRGESGNHAVYDTWQECVIDYAFYQTSYLRKIKTEDQYLSALAATYAESPDYYSHVKSESAKVLKKYSKSNVVP